CARWATADFDYW
nr:immunoglobulin heavy chain junction region [Macaca mulatta]MOV48815.1 immunoglobulin heavy chain junction region [Macaca mulatta]MOV48871.1 immunoglobulin heavy chain junction region [Macaca mulatta]MOV49067.1 immunoglobulin heavy chain junction region [Macaca mulatta]MOV49287.1 immunoglobulin heavy chain junction region [Macaca mulatta]